MIREKMAEQIRKLEVRIEKLKKNISTLELRKDFYEKEKLEGLQTLESFGWDFGKIPDPSHPNKIEIYDARLRVIMAENTSSGIEAKLKKNRKDLLKAENTLEQKKELLEQHKTMPKAMKDLEKTLAEMMFETDKKLRDEAEGDWKQSGIEDMPFGKEKREAERNFSEKWGYAYELMFCGDEWLKKQCAELAETSVYKLFTKTVGYTGPIINTQGISMGVNGLEGEVVGTKGRARVQTIWAGGYNIQRLHIRNLVHKIKEKN